MTDEQTPQIPHETQENGEPRVEARQRRRIKHQETFLDKYAELGEVCAAADAAGIDRSSHYHWLKTDEEYVKRFEDLEGNRVQRGNDTAYRLGVVGVLVPKTVAGARELVREHDPKVLIRWLETHDPKWRQHKIVELRMEDWDGDIDRLTPEAQEKLLEKLTSKLGMEAGTATGGIPAAVAEAVKDEVAE